jgi:SAM-dependent methyltransferase
MSASQLAFPSRYFDSVLSVEAFEHIEEVQSAASECHRVLVAGGELVVTVPNRWFPCENHGGNVLGIKFTRLPLVTYFPWLHDRVADLRVYTVSSLDRLFVPKGFTRTHCDYLWPTFEHEGNPLQPLLKPLFPVTRVLESSPVKSFGSSIVVRYVKVC